MADRPLHEYIFHGPPDRATPRQQAIAMLLYWRFWVAMVTLYSGLLLVLWTDPTPPLAFTVGLLTCLIMTAAFGSRSNWGVGDV